MDQQRFNSYAVQQRDKRQPCLIPLDTEIGQLNSTPCPPFITVMNHKYLGLQCTADKKKKLYN